MDNYESMLFQNAAAWYKELMSATTTRQCASIADRLQKKIDSRDWRLVCISLYGQSNATNNPATNLYKAVIQAAMARKIEIEYGFKKIESVDYSRACVAFTESLLSRL